MIDENRDPDLRDVRDDWGAPLPRPEMRERILRACEPQLRRRGSWRFGAIALLVLVSTLAALRIELRNDRPLNMERPMRLKTQNLVIPEQSVISAAPTTRPSRTRSIARKVVRSSNRLTDQPVTRFYLLVDAPPPLGDGILVRVMVPTSTLSVKGVPGLEGQISSVEADVLIGEDGMARAIRFVGFE